jgi:hypothetical protein
LRAHGATNKSHHVCARRRDGEAARDCFGSRTKRCPQTVCHSRMAWLRETSRYGVTNDRIAIVKKSTSDLEDPRPPLTRSASRTLLCGCMFSILLSATGCPNGDFTLEGWTGHHRDELVHVWGAPDQEMKDGDGGGYLLYSNNWADGYGRYNCRRAFVIDAQGTIQSWSAVDC